MRQQMMAQGDFREADRDVDDSDKSDDEGSQDAATSKLTMGPGDRASAASSEQMIGDPSKREDGTIEGEDDGQINSSSKDVALGNPQSL